MPEIVPNEELRSFLPRFYSAWEAEDFEAVRDMVSSGAHVLVLGTDPDEWWTGPDSTELWRIQTREMGGMAIAPGKVVAYSLGNVGWMADEPMVTFGNGIAVRMRVTIVLVIERGHWRLVQWHVSIPQGNEATLGRSLTTSIESIERSVRDSRPDVQRGSAPDGTVTIVFTDIESSAVLLQRLGDTGFMRLLAWHDDIVRKSTEEHRGFVVKSQGDGSMLAFPSAATALRASLAIRDRIVTGFDGLPVRVRAGLHSGEAIKHDEDFYGRTVVIAARIGALALGGEILASDLVYALARGLGTFNFGAARPAVLKGLDGNFEVYPVLA